MANGEWRMANGEWRMANGESQVEKGPGAANDIPYLATRHYRPGFIRSSIGPWQHGQTCGNRTLIAQILQ
jgi:hypothetical protein